jgi:hypothetical protein
MSTSDYFVQAYAAGGQAGCKDSKCEFGKGTKLAKGALRVGVEGPNQFESTSVKWYHRQCFFAMMKRARTATVPDDVSGFLGFDQLSEEDQQLFKGSYTEFKANKAFKEAEKATKEADKTARAAKKAAKQATKAKNPPSKKRKHGNSAEAAKQVPSPVSTTATLEAGTNTQEQRSEERAKRLARFECVDCL